MHWRKFSRPNDPDSFSLSAAVAAGPGVAIPFNDCAQVCWLVKGEGTIDGGIVLIESADERDYAGTWNELDRVNAATLNGGKLTGNTFPFPPGVFVRGNVLDPITGGGNITVRLDGLQG